MRKKLNVLNASLGKIRRNFTSMIVSGDDSNIYVGTMSGDVVKMRLNCQLNEINKPTLIGAYGRHNPRKSLGKDCEKYMNGVRDLIYLNNERQLIIGAGDGTIELVEERNILIKDYPMPTWPMFKAVTLLQLSFTFSTWYNKGFVFREIVSAKTKKSEWLCDISQAAHQSNYLYWHRFLRNLHA